MEIFKNIQKVLFLLVPLMLIFTGCGSKEKEPEEPELTKEEIMEKESYPFTFIDTQGKEVLIQKAPKKIVSLSPAITEVVTTMGGNVVGRTIHCDYPESVTNIEEIGDMYGPNYEAIVALKPDLILASVYTSDEVIEKLEDNGLLVIKVFENDSIEGIYTMIEEIGQILKNEETSDSLIASIQEALEVIEEESLAIEEKPSVYYMIKASEEENLTATGDTLIHEIIEISGGRNIASEKTGGTFPLEELLEVDPDIIITSVGSEYKESLAEMPSYKDLAAVKDGYVFETDTILVDRAGPRINEGATNILNIIKEYIALEAEKEIEE